MGDFFIGIGVLLAIIGPLLLIPITWLLHRFILKPLVKQTQLSIALSLAIVAGAVLISYIPGKLEFDRLCAKHESPMIAERIKVDGFYRMRMHAYEASPFLKDAVFEYVEAADMYEEGKYFRYSLEGDGTINKDAIPAVISTHEVIDTFSQLSYGIMLSEKRVFERAGKRELARAGQVLYQGGPLSLLFGASAMSSCPDVMTPEGATNFEIYYDLEHYVLGGD